LKEQTGQQRDPSRTIGIVLNGRDRGRNADFVALPVNHSVKPLVAAAAYLAMGNPPELSGKAR